MGSPRVSRADRSLASPLCSGGAVLVVRIGLLCLQSVRRGNVLPLLLFSSSGLPLLNGQFGPPTILGFAVFTTGLALAARNADDESESRRGCPREATAEEPCGAARPTPIECMVPLPRAIKPMVLLIGNYPPDRQQSMQSLRPDDAGRPDRRGRPGGVDPAAAVLRTLSTMPVASSRNGWLTSISSSFFRGGCGSRLKSAPALVHICDHSNAMYARQIRGVPVVATCHDLLAVRGALGEQTDCPASLTGKLLQRWIISGLARRRS